MRLIYLSPVPWDSFAQRPHEMVRCFHARTQGQVLWVDPYPTRFPALADLAHRRPQRDAGCEVPEWLVLLRPRALPVEPLPFSVCVNRLLWSEIFSAVRRFAGGRTILGVGKPSMLALQLLSGLRFSASFYDAMDDVAQFYHGWSRYAMSRRVHRTLQAVTTVLTSSSLLQSRFNRLAPDVRLLPNACASGRLPMYRGPRPPLADRAPVVGYVGTIAQWFDWELVIALAKARPRGEFRLIGPMCVRAPRSLPSNIRIFPALSHAQAMEAVARFDAGLIPFRNTRLTSAVDPIKYYEYRALGLAVVSSAFGEMARRRESRGVYLVDRGADVPELLDQALSFTDSTESVTQFRIAHSWESRFEQAGVFAP